MADLDTLEQKVDDLGQLGNSIFRFREVYKDIEEAAKTTTNAQISRLLSIVNEFRVKIPNLDSHNRIRANANDIAVILMKASLDERIERIELRNDAINKLTSALQSEIDKGNNDAEFLKQIKNGVDKANQTVAQIRELIERLTATDAGTKDEIEALVAALDGITTIFKPNAA